MVLSSSFSIPSPSGPGARSKPVGSPPVQTIGGTKTHDLVSFLCLLKGPVIPHSILELKHALSSPRTAFRFGPILMDL